MSTFENSKRILKNTVFLYIRMFVVIVISLFTVRVILRTLGIEDYGVYSVIGGVVTSLSFITSVLSNASQRFFSLCIAKEDILLLKSTFSTMFTLYFVVCVVLFIIAETLGLWFVYDKMVFPPERATAVFYMYQFSLCSFIVSVLTSPFQALIISYERMNIYAYVSIAEAILKLVIVYFLIILDFDKLILYSFLVLVVTVIVNLVYIIYTYIHYSAARISVKTINVSIFKELFSYSSWTLIGTMAYMFNTQGFNIILNLFFGPIVNAAYAIGNQVRVVINQFSANFYTAVRPSLIKSYGRKDYNESINLLEMSSKIIFSLLFVIVLPLSIKIDLILQFWLGEISEYMVDFVRLLLIWAIILSISDPITTVVQAANKVKIYHLMVDGFTLISLPFTYFTCRYGLTPQYAFYISILILIIAHIIRLFILQNIILSYPITEYLKNVLLPIVYTITVALPIAIFMSEFFGDTFFQMIISCITSFGIASLSIMFLLFSKSERYGLCNLIKKRFKQ